MSSKSKIVIEAGFKVDRLTVIKLSHIKNYKEFFNCLCECGKTIIREKYYLLKGINQSCGCLRMEIITRPRPINPLVNSPEYRACDKAKSRCSNPNDRSFKDYGGRGIEFRFSSFMEFFTEVGRKPTSRHSLERINVNGHYEKGNVKWATSSEQNRNKRNSNLITLNNVTLNLVAWAELLNILPTAIYNRITLYKWCHECALTLPKHSRCSHVSKSKKGE